MKKILVCAFMAVLVSGLRAQTPEYSAAKAKEHLQAFANSPVDKNDAGDPCVFVKKECGIDYKKVIQGVLRKDSAAVKQMLVCSTCVDGASAEVHHDNLR